MLRKGPHVATPEGRFSSNGWGKSLERKDGQDWNGNLQKPAAFPSPSSPPLLFTAEAAAATKVVVCFVFVKLCILWRLYCCKKCWKKRKNKTSQIARVVSFTHNLGGKVPLSWWTSVFALYTLYALFNFSWCSCDAVVHPGRWNTAQEIRMIITCCCIHIVTSSFPWFQPVSNKTNGTRGLCHDIKYLNYIVARILSSF